MVYAIIVLGIILIDQISKFVMAAVSNGEEFSNVIEIIPDFLNLEYCENTSGMMGVFSNVDISPKTLAICFITITVVVVIGITLLLFLTKNKSKWLKTSLSFIIGGAVGNLIDRLINFSEESFVRDFIHVIIDFGRKEIFPYIFNLADSFLVVGAIMLLIFLLFMDKDAVFRKKNNG